MVRECGTESGNEKFKVSFICWTDFSFYKRDQSCISSMAKIFMNSKLRASDSQYFQVKIIQNVYLYVICFLLGSSPASEF